MSHPEGGKRVAWAELFFDLVFVFAITELVALLHHDHSWAGVGRAVVVFLPVYWVWVGTTMQTNRRDLDRPAERIAVFFVALCGLVMAFALPYAYDDRGLLFALAYWAARLGFGLWAFRGELFHLQPFTVSMVFTGPLLVVGALLDEPARELLWLAAAVIDLAMPSVLRRRLAAMTFDAGHLTERFGLFVLIAIGESVVAIGAPLANSGTAVGLATLAAVAGAFLLCCGLFWVYFHFANDAMRHALTIAPTQLTITRHVLSYGHVAFIAAVVADRGRHGGDRRRAGTPPVVGLHRLPVRWHGPVPRDVRLHALDDVPHLGHHPADRHRGRAPAAAAGPAAPRARGDLPARARGRRAERRRVRPRRARQAPRGRAGTGLTAGPRADVHPLALLAEQAEDLHRPPVRGAEPVRQPGVELRRLALAQHDVLVGDSTSRNRPERTYSHS